MPRLRTVTAVATMALIALVLGGPVLGQSDDDVMNAAPGEEMGSVVRAENVWSRPSPTAEGVGVAYMSLVNDGEVDDALIGVSTPAAASAELHETTSDADGMMSMSPVDSIPLPAGGETLLEPGGYHVMLVDLAEPLVEGASIELTLQFEQAGELNVTSAVLPMDATGPSDEMPGDATESEAPVAALPTTITVEAYDNYFQPKTIEAPANTEIKVVLKNYGFLPHNIAFYTKEGGGLLADGSLTSVIDPELEASVRFTTPGPGEYFILCVVHPEMTGTLIVR